MEKLIIDNIEIMEFKSELHYNTKALICEHGYNSNHFQAELSIVLFLDKQITDDALIQFMGARATYVPAHRYDEYYFDNYDVHFYFNDKKFTLRSEIEVLDSRTISHRLTVDELQNKFEIEMDISYKHYWKFLEFFKEKMDRKAAKFRIEIEHLFEGHFEKEEFFKMEKKLQLEAIDPEFCHFCDSYMK